MRLLLYFFLTNKGKKLCFQVKQMEATGKYEKE